MEKSLALAALGQRELLLPTWVTAALRANDRLKLYLTVLQAAAAHAAHPHRDVPDLSSEMRAAGVADAWLRDLPATARRLGEDIVFPDWPRLVQSLAEDLATMARPVLESTGADADAAIPARTQYWQHWLASLPSDRVNMAQIDALVQGRRGDSDSLHLLVMDLHKQINQLAQALASEHIDGAHAWQVRPADHALITAFMRGLNRTAGLKFDHPGLATAVTRDGERLLLQNDIGTNDAHVLVMQVVARTITLTYSDLHRRRLAFFQTLLAPFGAQWSTLESRINAELNEGGVYCVSTARFDCSDDTALRVALEGIGSRIVFLIDWNHARKRLQTFVARPEAIAILAEAARRDIGHRAWLQAGGAPLIVAAMQSVGEGVFRIGDRLDEVMGATDARNFLIAVLQLAFDALHGGQPPARVADQTRMLLARHVRHYTREFDLMTEHAGYCQALAQAVSDGLAHGMESTPKEARALAVRAKEWEHQADEMVTQARQQALRQPRWRPFVQLITRADDVADALEEAAFLIGLMADGHSKGWNSEVRNVVVALAATVLQATQNQVKALAIARALGANSDAADHEAFLAATWEVLEAERRCDGLLRDARRVILNTVHDGASLMLANDLVAALELASDYLLGAAYMLRDIAFDKAGVRT